MTATLSRPDLDRDRPLPRKYVPKRQHRLSLVALLLGTGVLYLWNLSASGYANEFYAAAVQAGTQSWKALLFGSLDSANYITVDKPPAALWVMGLSGRLFGFNSWSMLAPQALMGVAAVGLLYATVKRWFGHAAGLFAGAALALTPVAVLMFRFNNPDALLTLLLVAGAYCVVRAVESGRTGWLLLAGSALGFGFLTKMLQAFLVLPAFALVYLIAGKPRLRRRIGQLLLAGVSLVVSAGWWIALVELWPASSRPYIGGSEGNSALELALGYNGLGRLTGSEGNGGGGGGFSGAAGLFRLFNENMGGQVSWLLPAALIALVAGLVLTFRRPRTDRTRAALVLWGGWLLVTGLVLSFMEGTVHEYYTVALAPSVVAVVAITGRLLWLERRRFVARAALAAMVGATGAWSYVLLNRTADWYPPLRYVVAVGAVVAVVGLLAGGRWKKLAAVALIVGLLTGLAGSGAYALQTAATAHSGSTPTAGPATSGGMGGGNPRLGTMPSGGQGGPGGQQGTPPDGSASSGSASSTDSASGSSDPTAAGSTSSAAGNSTTTAGNRPTGGGTTSSAELTALLKASDTTWAAAVGTSQTAASLELASGKAVMAIGGWSGSDESTTLAAFQALVKAGKVHYFVAGGQGGGDGVLGQITSWVEANYTATTVGGTTVYDLTA
ncbi:ArnT family glycosyltransferase [Cryptosporangium aurantiacum]|uniref:4-amino-4-deoxy-L-arabinose transferase n=1 Tax=Cryptosporangium aurantiacum TaxID=134849 RepID=A0A1M7HJD7_9ACTN|nr:glycosyltransferase family 39 protein [Cryptosporangium aurantiacum]SHM28267.1 4-amino-4-deoxy-L-arabinose transferase [Cryptosporangium aurantiacum]